MQTALQVLGILLIASAAVGFLRFGYRVTMTRHDEETFDDWINRQY